MVALCAQAGPRLEIYPIDLNQVGRNRLFAHGKTTLIMQRDILLFGWKTRFCRNRQIPVQVFYSVFSYLKRISMQLNVRINVVSNRDVASRQ